MSPEKHQRLLRVVSDLIDDFMQVHGVNRGEMLSLLTVSILLQANAGTRHGLTAEDALCFVIRETARNMRADGLL